MKKSFALILALAILLTFTLTACIEKQNDDIPSGTVDNGENGNQTNDKNNTNDSDSSENNDNQQEFFSELLRTGEIITAEQMEDLKSNALSWQSAIAGISGFGEVIAIESADGSNQQVFVSIDRGASGAVTFERIEIQPPDGVQARIISASSGGGSGELMIGYIFQAEDFEWIELFFAEAGWIISDNTPQDGHVTTQWENITEWQPDMVKWLNELNIAERQFK